MNPKTIVSKLKKYKKQLSDLNKLENWGTLKSIATYFDYISAFIIHGCLIDQYVNGKFYTYKNYFRKRVITQRRLENIISRVNSSDYIHLLENKTHFNVHFNKWVRRKWLDSDSMNFEDFVELCNDDKALFIKPLDACEGKGISRILPPKDWSDLKKLFEELKHGHYIIEQELTQHPGMVFGNKSVNTIRINTILDKNNEVHFFKPVLRTGVGDAYVDNYNAGGVEYAIDTESGIITMPGYFNGKMTETYHPGTNIKMVGYEIPMWSEILSEVAKAAKHIPQCRYIGWDVAITPDGIEFIEGNHNPGYVCMEYFGETGWYDKIKKYL